MMQETYTDTAATTTAAPSMGTLDKVLYACNMFWINLFQAISSPFVALYTLITKVFTATPPQVKTTATQAPSTAPAKVITAPAPIVVATKLNSPKSIRRQLQAAIHAGIEPLLVFLHQYAQIYGTDAANSLIPTYESIVKKSILKYYRSAGENQLFLDIGYAIQALNCKGIEERSQIRDFFKPAILYFAQTKMADHETAQAAIEQYMADLAAILEPGEVVMGSTLLVEPSDIAIVKSLAREVSSYHAMIMDPTDVAKQRAYLHHGKRTTLVGVHLLSRKPSADYGLEQIRDYIISDTFPYIMNLSRLKSLELFIPTIINWIQKGWISRQDVLDCFKGEGYRSFINNLSNALFADPVPVPADHEQQMAKNLALAEIRLNYAKAQQDLLIERITGWVIAGLLNRQELAAAMSVSPTSSTIESIYSAARNRIRAQFYGRVSAGRDVRVVDAKTRELLAQSHPDYARLFRDEMQAMTNNQIAARTYTKVAIDPCPARQTTPAKALPSYAVINPSEILASIRDFILDPERTINTWSLTETGDEPVNLWTRLLHRITPRWMTGLEKTLERSATGSDFFRTRAQWARTYGNWLLTHTEVLYSR